jgi:fatty-acyl-CoA synthase
VQPGDRVATLAWNTGRHIEAWYAIMGMGAVCHTLNPRLFAEQLCYIINHAEDKIIFTDLTFAPILAEHRAKMPSVKHIVVLTDEAHEDPDFPGPCFRDLVEQSSADFGGAASTRTPPRRSATPPARRATRRACSIRTARTSSTPW